MERAKATWIWYPGDFEIWLGNKFNNRRTERGAMFPPFWKQDSHWATVEFCKTIAVADVEKITIATEGDFSLKLDGVLQFGMPDTFLIPPGEHQLSIKVHNPASPPALFIDGETVKTDGSWLVTYEDKIWIDELGTAHGSGIYMKASHWNLYDIHRGPSAYHLCRKRIPAKVTSCGRGILADFGRETMGYLILHDLKGEGMVNIFYGESREEALDRAYCETLDQLCVSREHITDQATHHTTARHTHYTLENSKAFRYVYIETTDNISIGDVGLDYEYAPHDDAHCGRFRCDDEEVNRIWEVAAYTLDLTTREFFIDGVKRDRWTWSGDAIQSYLMNYYLHFDTECVKRTIRQLRGKDPVTAHVNTIMDYSFYWFKSIHDYYLYTGDLDFLREIYPRMRTLMDYCVKRTNVEGMAEGQADDWIFVDWVDFPMHKRGVLCFEQILFCKSLQVMAQIATLLQNHPLKNPPQGSLTSTDYTSDAIMLRAREQALSERIRALFWDDTLHALTHAVEDGKMNKMVTRFPNMFAIIYDLATDDERQDILRHVLLNDEVEPITTPYMRFYELEALCMMGQQSHVLHEIKAYWGGMLREGATTFWEKYVPSEQGTAHLTMYGRPYGKSLCHAWGASPIYLLGRYFLGVRPLLPGYEEYEVHPVLGAMEWMEGEVPTPSGKIKVKADRNQVIVESDGGHGTLIIGELRTPIPSGKTVCLRVSKTE